LSELYGNIFIIAVFDCCRVRMDKEPNEKNPAMRGGHYEEE